MRTLVVAILISFLPFTAFATLTTDGTEPVSGLIKIPNVTIDPTYLAPINPTKAAGLDVAGATGGLTHPACVAETARRAAMKPPQPPPNGDFPCVVPTSNSSGIVEGLCFVNECRGVSSTGLNGIMSALSSLSSLSSAVNAVLSRLLQQSDQSTPPSNTGNPGIDTSPQSTLPTPSSGLVQPLDTSKLLSDSAAMVSNLLFLLNPPAVQPTK
ncbi:hypothetical protein HY971_02650 [Candidatus Kaiserbacteria bacterium]|nr:hypothetical protein [Candidatus Kaiserbacteria bacterium]